MTANGLLEVTNTDVHPFISTPIELIQLMVNVSPSSIGTFVMVPGIPPPGRVIYNG